MYPWILEQEIENRTEELFKEITFKMNKRQINHRSKKFREPKQYKYQEKST